jgi:hypothetical protein
MTEVSVGRVDTRGIAREPLDDGTRVLLDGSRRRQLRVRHQRRARQIAARRRLLLAVGAISTVADFEANGRSTS